MVTANLQNRRPSDRASHRKLAFESLETRAVLAASSMAATAAPAVQANDGVTAQAVVGSDFVTALYADVLHRDPDPDGLLALRPHERATQYAAADREGQKRHAGTGQCRAG